MTIDFDHLTTEQTVLFYRLRGETIDEYNKLSEILLSRYDDLDWYVNNVTSRNPGFSDLLYVIRCVKLVETLAQTNSIDNIKTSNIHVYTVLKQRFNTIYIGKSKLWYLLRSVKRKIWNSVFIARWSIGAFRCQSKERKQKWVNGDIDIDIDIDIFCEQQDPKFFDRYYGNVFERIGVEERKRMGFIVIYCPVPNKKAIERIAETAPIHILYHWDFLNACDYLKSYIKTLSLKKRNLSYEYLGYDLSYILKDMYRDTVSFYYFFAFIYERFIRRLKNNNIPIRHYVDWYENQSFDRSFYWTMNKYYPEVSVNGYLGFIVDPLSAPMVCPTNAELDRHIVPQNLYSGCQYLNDQMHYYKGKVDCCPFYRSQKVWTAKVSRRNTDEIIVLIPMGLDPVEIRYKTRFVLNLFNEGIGENVRFVLKPHPTFGETLIREIVDGDPRIEIVSGNIYDYLVDASVVIAALSTTTYEALALGIPIIQLIDEKCELIVTQPSMAGRLWQDVVGPAEFIDALHKLPSHMDEKDTEKTKEYFFSKETEQNRLSIFVK